MPDGVPPGEGQAGAAARSAAEALMAQGMDFHDGGKLDEAIDAYRRAVEADPTFVIAHNNLGMVYIDKEQFPHAVAALKRAVQVDPTYGEAYNNLGYVHRKMSEDALAAAYYEKFLELDSEVDEAPKIRQWALKVRTRLGSLPSIEPGAASRDEGAAPQTGSEDRTLIMDELPPGLFDNVPGAPAAEEPAQAPAPSPPASPPPSPAAPAAPPMAAPPMAPPPGVASPGVAPPSVAPPSVAPPSVAPPSGPPQETAEAVCEKGIAAFEASDLGLAETLLRDAVRMNSTLGVARSALGRVLAKAGRYEEAAEELREAVTLDPTDAAAFYVLGYTLKTLGMEHEAAEAYEHFLELTPDAPEGPKIRSWVESIRATPELTPAELLAQASSDLQAGKLDEAASACEHVLEGDGANVTANILMGRILFEKQDYIRATTLLKRAEPAAPDDPEIPFYLGQAYSQRGQVDEAVQAYERCLQLSPDGPYAQAASEWLESMSGPQAAPAGGQCGYCFRSFPEDELSAHDGKMVCGDCLASLGVETGPQAPAIIVRPTGMERAAAMEVVRAKRKHRGNKLMRILLTSFLVLFLLVGVLLLVMRNGWLKGPLEKSGVYSALKALGLGDTLRNLGIEMPTEVVPGPNGGNGEVVTPDNGNGGDERPLAEPLVIRGPAAPVAALPLKPLEIKLETQGGAGQPSFRLLSGPPGVEVDSDSGTVRWRPLAGEKKLKLPSRHKIEVEAKTTKGDKATFAFEIVVNLAFKEGSVIDAGVPPGERLCLAVGKLNVTRNRAPDTIAVGWGRYREGFVRLLYQSTPGRFTRGEPMPLGGQPTSIVVADVTGDGRADAVVANWYQSRIHILRQDEVGNIAQDEWLPTARGVSHLAVGDIDGDGRMDVAAAHWAAAEINVYMQRAEGDAPGRLVGPATRTTTRVSGWNRIFVGPLRGGAKGGVVYLLCGSAGEPFFKVFPVKDGVLAPYESSTNAELLPERPIEARLLRMGEGAPLIAALVGGEKPSLHLLGAKGFDLEEVALADIDLAPFPVTMEVADFNSDGADDIAVLYPEELRIYLNAGGLAGPFLAVGTIDIPGGIGPLVAGEFTGDGILDLLVAREDGKLQVVKATVEVLP